MRKSVAVVTLVVIMATTPVSAATASTITPACAVEADLPRVNIWGDDSWVFMEVKIPTFEREKVILDEEIEGDEIPVLQFCDYFQIPYRTVTD